MPTYVYRRTDGSTFEQFQSITADPLTTCPDTGQSVRRVITGGTGFILKGSGFYQTDYVNTPPEKVSNGNNNDTDSTDAKEKAPAKPDEEAEPAVASDSE